MRLTRITGIAALASTLLATLTSIALLLPLHAKTAERDGTPGAPAVTAAPPAVGSNLPG